MLSPNPLSFGFILGWPAILIGPGVYLAIVNTDFGSFSSLFFLRSLIFTHIFMGSHV